MRKYIDADKLREIMYHEAFETDTEMQRWDSGCWIRYKMFENALDQMPSADVIELNAFGNEVYQYIASNKDEDANFLAGLETAVVIAEKMAGVYEEVEE